MGEKKSYGRKKSPMGEKNFPWEKKNPMGEEKSHGNIFSPIGILYFWWEKNKDVVQDLFVF